MGRRRIDILVLSSEAVRRRRVIPGQVTGEGGRVVGGCGVLNILKCFQYQVSVMTVVSFSGIF